jgi:integrase
MASVQKRGDNSWLLVVEAGFEANGKRIKRTKTVKAEGVREARKLLAIFQTEVEAGEYIAPEKMTFSNFVEEWQNKYAESALAPLTYKNYKTILQVHILPKFGHMRMDNIKPMHIVTFLEELSKPGARKDGHGDTLSSGTVEYIYRVIKNIFNRAIDWQLLKRHPMDGIKKPKVTQSDMDYYDENEAQDVIEALYKEPTMWRLFFIGALLGGFRRGELIALNWTDVDCQKNTISVNKSISLTVDGKAILKNPKSKSSKRTVTMPEWYMLDLKDYHHDWKINRMMVGDKWETGDQQYVFHVGFGKAIYHSSPTHWWKNFTVRHGLKFVRLHDLRHSAATILIQNDVSMKAIQERLGHSKHQTTADLYAHVAQSVSRAAADKLEKLNPHLRTTKTNQMS